jgi:hypothetical protein
MFSASVITAYIIGLGIDARCCKHAILYLQAEAFPLPLLNYSCFPSIK